MAAALRVEAVVGSPILVAKARAEHKGAALHHAGVEVVAAFFFPEVEGRGGPVLGDEEEVGFHWGAGGEGCRVVDFLLDRLHAAAIGEEVSGKSNERDGRRSRAIVLRTTPRTAEDGVVQVELGARRGRV